MILKSYTLLIVKLTKAGIMTDEKLRSSVLITNLDKVEILGHHIFVTGCIFQQLIKFLFQFGWLSKPS